MKCAPKMIVKTMKLHECAPYGFGRREQRLCNSVRLETQYTIGLDQCIAEDVKMGSGAMRPFILMYLIAKNKVVVVKSTIPGWSSFKAPGNRSNHMIGWQRSQSTRHYWRPGEFKMADNILRNLSDINWYSSGNIKICALPISQPYLFFLRL